MASFRICALVLLSTAAALAQTSPVQGPLRLTLADAEKMAVQNHPALASAQFTAAAANQVTRQYRAGYEPVFSANLTAVGADEGSRIAAGGLNNPVVYNRFGSGVGVSQLITDFGRTSNLVASARLHAQAEDKNIQATRADILLETDRAYYNLLRAQALLKVAQETVNTRQVLVDQVEALAKSQMKSTLDVSFARVNLADAQLTLAGAQNEVKSAEARLLTAMGIPGERNFTVEDTANPRPLPDDVRQLVGEALQERPDLASLRLEQGSSERSVKAERALSFPSVGLFATAGYVPAGAQAIPGNFGAAGLNINIPLFNGGLYAARRSEAQFKERSVEQNVRDLENRISRDVQMAYMNALTAYERIGLTAQMLDQARLALELAQRRYDLGLSSIVELSQAQLNMTNAETATVRAKYDYQSEQSMLNYQLGVLR